MRKSSKSTIKKRETRKARFLRCYKNALAVISTACLKARIDRGTYYSWREDDELFRKKCEEIEEGSVDFAESKLYELINGVKLPDDKFFQYQGEVITQKAFKQLAPDTTAIIFYLKTKGKHRGYIERQEFTGKDGEPLVPHDPLKVSENKLIISVVNASDADTISPSTESTDQP